MRVPYPLVTFPGPRDIAIGKDADDEKNRQN